MRQVLIAASLAVAATATAGEDMIIWYDGPATQWEEALPIGNGRLGAMIFGGVGEELYQLNEETLWSGRPVNSNPNPEAAEWLPKVREALFAGEWDLAKELCRKMQGLYTESYLPLGDIRIKYGHSTENVTDYRRELNISQAVCTTSYKAAGVKYTNEVFATAPGDLIISRFTADKAGGITMEITLDSQLRHSISCKGGSVTLSGRAPVHVEPSYVNHPDPVLYEVDGHKGMRYAMQVRVDAKNGKVTYTDRGITVEGADEAVVKISAATSFNGMHNDPYVNGKDEMALVNAPLDRAAAIDYATLRKNHVDDYRSYFDRVKLTLSDGDAPEKDTFSRLIDYYNGASDPALEALYFQFGRYLLISSSRPGGVPANLQGIWNQHLRAPWSSNYTTNINTEMNYWPAEVTNLSEMHQPLVEQIAATAVNGEATAKNFYGARGWALSHNSDIWGQTNPVGNLGDGDPMWANWYMGSPWMSQHLYEKYRYSGDKGYLANTAYPVMKGAALFCLDWLVDDGNGHLVTAPSSSPENLYIGTDGKPHSTTIGSTMDMEIIHDLFTNVIEATEILDVDADLRAELIAAREKLYPLQVGKKGNLQEWIYDYDDQDPHHRHVSHLFGLHPGRQISPVSAPEFAKAARRTLELRGDDGTGWSLAWKINFWARLLDGDHAYSLLRNLLRVVSDKNENYKNGGGSYANLFCAHPPFQIDGNFGGTAGMAEMLLQSHNGEIHLLPALPGAWQKGEVAGLKARGNVEVDIRWDGGQLEEASLTPRNTGPIVLRTAMPVTIDGAAVNSRKDVTEWGTFYVTEVDGNAGESINVKVKK